ncbi:MAG: ATP-binding protein [Planctomycetota bacterium]
MQGGDAPPTDHLGRKVKRLMLVRLLVVLAALALVAVRESPRWVEFGLDWPPYWVIVTAAVLNLIYVLLFRRMRYLEQFAAFQIAVDTVLVGALVLFTGGPTSIFNFLFFACVIAAALILPTGLMLATATLAGSLMVAAAATYYVLGTPFFLMDVPFLREVIERSTQGDLPETVSLLMVQVSILFLMGILLSTIVQRLSGAHILNEEILDNMSEGVIALDRDTRIVHINRAARRMVGVSVVRDFAGVPLRDVLDGVRHEVLIRAMLARTGQAVELDIVSLETGVTSPVEIVVSRLEDRRRRSRGSVAVLLDLTQRRMMERTLRRMERLEIVERMATAITHEIRNPLSSIRGSAQMLVESTALSEEERKFLQLIIQETDRLDKLVMDFMLFSRTQRMNPAKCGIREVAEEVLTMLSRAEGGNGNRVELRIPKGLCCHADRDLLKQVFYNLAINAFQAMTNGGKLTIGASPMGRATGGRPRNVLRSRGRESVPGVSISFADEGPGIPSEIRGKLFDPFFTTKARGTGIGLSIVERIVEAHDGNITVDSRPGEGATFRVWLPSEPPPSAGKIVP